MRELPLARRERPVTSPEELELAWTKFEKAHMDNGFRRGLFELYQPEDVEAEQRRAEAACLLKQGGVEHAEEIMEMDRLQNSKTSWNSAILVFLVSMFIFIGAGSQQWSWEFVLKIGRAHV